jgi:hypothetical protein
MVWLLIIVGLLIFAPRLIGIFAIGLVAVAIPFAIFFAVWALIFYAVVHVEPDAILTGVIGGFIAGIVAARMVVKPFID